MHVSALPVTLPSVQVSGGDAGMLGAADASAPVPSNAYPVHLSVSLPARLDVSRVFEQSVTATIANRGDRAVYTLVTPATVGFLIEPPHGPVVRCGADTAATAFAELTTTLGVHARTAVTIDLGTTCGSVLRQAGLYRVRPRLDTRRTSPPTGSTTFWQGEVVGEPMMLRIRQSADPLPAPRLDPPGPAAVASVRDGG
jgi:hypothetical protein